jgi:hypothetical protein
VANKAMNRLINQIVAVIGSDYHTSSWGKTFVFVRLDNEAERHIYKIAGATNKEVWSSPGYGSYQEVAVSLPDGARVKIFRDSGNEYGSRREYRQALMSKNLFFVVDSARSIVKIKGDGVYHKGGLSGALREISRAEYESNDYSPVCNRGTSA